MWVSRSLTFFRSNIRANMEIVRFKKCLKLMKFVTKKMKQGYMFLRSRIKVMIFCQAPI